MKLPDPTKVSAAELAEELYRYADRIIAVDGDRDHMNTSGLRVADTMIAARLMLIAWQKLVAMATTKA